MCAKLIKQGGLISHLNSQRFIKSVKQISSAADFSTFLTWWPKSTAKQAKPASSLSKGSLLLVWIRNEPSAILAGGTAGLIAQIFFTPEGTSLSQTVPSKAGCSALCLEQHQAWHSTLAASKSNSILPGLIWLLLKENRLTFMLK